MAILTELDDLRAFEASRWFEGRRTRQLFEVVLISAVVDVHLGFNAFAALDALLPFAVVPFAVVMAAQGIAAMISRAAVVGI